MIKAAEKKHQPDFILLGTLILLVLTGFLVLATASVPYSLRIANDPNYFLMHQLEYGAIGLVLGFIAYKLPIDKIKKINFSLFFFLLFLMYSVFLPFWSHEAKGATRWIELGFFHLQPSEPLKLAAIIYLATLIDKFKKKSLKPFIIIMILIAASLLLQKDLSTLIIIALTACVIYFCGQGSFKNIALIGLAGILAIAAFIAIEPYRLQRIETLFNPSKDLLGSGYHPQQALISIGSGQILGSGLGLSVQKFGFLPESITDSIFAIFAEETGFVGCTFLVLLFLVFAYRVFSMAKKSEDLSCKLMACGIGFWITFQAFINISSMTGLVPVSGIPLPFISNGGSHMIAELAAMGVLLNISKNV
jgi:cell division protein FtsW